MAFLSLPLSKDLFAIQTGMSLKIKDRQGILLRETLSAEGGRATWLPYDELLNHHSMPLHRRQTLFTSAWIFWLFRPRVVAKSLLASRVVSGAEMMRLTCKNAFWLS